MLKGQQACLVLVVILVYGCANFYDCPMGRGPVYNMLDNVRTPFSRKTVYTWGWHFTFWTSVIFDSPWCVVHQAEINTSALMPPVSCDLIFLAHQIATKNWRHENSIPKWQSQISVKASFWLARYLSDGMILKTRTEWEHMGLISKRSVSGYSPTVKAQMQLYF